MTYTVSEVNSCTKKIIFKLPNVDLKPHIQKALQNKQKTVELKGYRKGKAPMSMIEQFYGPQVENEALSRFIYEQIDNAVKTEGINPIDYPTIENADYKAPNLNFEAVVEFFPNLKIKDLGKYSFKKDKVEVTDKDIEETKAKYLKSRTTLETVEDASYKAKNGDYVHLNFQGKLSDGSMPDNMKGVDYPLELGSQSFIKGFEEALIGLKKGDKKDIPLTFPTDYHVDTLKGQPVTFSIEVVLIKQKKVPALNLELAKELGFETLEQMESTIKETILTQKERAAKEKLEKEVLEKLAEDHKVDVPEVMVKNQKKALVEQMLPGLTRSGFNEQQIQEYMSKWENELNQKAIFQVHTALILDQISKDQKVEVTPADIDAKYEEVAKSAGMPVEDVKNFYKKDQNNYRNFFYNIKEQKTFEKIFSLVKLS
jgi:trigger factor